MADNLPPEREVKDFFFKHLLKIRVHPPQTGGDKGRQNLISSARKYGLVFVGCPNGFKVVKTSDFMAKAAQADKAVTNIVEDFSFHASVPLPSTPVHLAVSADNLTLAVCLMRESLSFCLMYDIRAFANTGASPTPFLEVKLGSEANITLAGFAWNPGAEFSSLFASCMSDGSVSLWQVKDTALNIVATRKADLGATCLCWSLKGKQVVVGRADGSLVQLDHQLKDKKLIPCPTSYQNVAVQVFDVLWQSTHVFVAAYLPVGSEDSEPPCVYVVTVPKGANPSYVCYEDVCFGSDDYRQHKYYFHQVLDWETIMCASANALEVTLLGKNPEDKSKWDLWSLEDSGRAEMPLTDSHEETWPTGMAIDDTSQDMIVVSDTVSYRPAPILMLMSTDGLLIAFHMININPNVPSINHPAEILSAEGERKGTVAMTPPAAVAKPADPVAKALFQSPGTPSPVTVKPATTAVTTPKASLFGGASATSTPLTTAGKVGIFGGNGAAPNTAFSSIGTAGTTSAFGGAAKPSIFGAAPTSGASKPSIFGATATTTAAKPGLFGTATTTSAATGFTFGGTPSSSSGSSAFSFAKPAESKPQATGLPTYSDAASTKPTTPATIATSRPVAFSGAPAVATTTVKDSSGISGGKPATSMPGVSVPTPVIPKTAGQPAPTIPAAVRPQPAAAPTIPAAVRPQPGAAPATLATVKPQPSPALAPSATVRPPPTAVPAAATTHPSGHAGKHKLDSVKTVTTKSGSSDNLFTKSILDEMSHFEKELSEMKKRAGTLRVQVGTLPEMKLLKESTHGMLKFCEDIKDTTQSINSDIHTLKSDCLEAFGLVEECRAREQRNKDPRYQLLLQSRSLDALSSKKLREIRTNYQYLESSVRVIDEKLDMEWDEYRRQKNKGRKLQTPLSDTIYQTISSNNNVITSQTQMLDKLTAQLQGMRLYNTSARWQHSRPDEKGDHLSPVAPRSNLPSSQTRKSDLHYSSPSGMAALSSPKLEGSPRGVVSSPISPEKQAQLRHVLQSRRITPVKSTAPANLSMSKIVSATQLRKMLAEENELTPAIEESLTNPTAEVKPAAMPATSAATQQSQVIAAEPIKPPAFNTSTPTGASTVVFRGSAVPDATLAARIATGAIAAQSSVKPTAVVLGTLPSTKKDDPPKEEAPGAVLNFGSSIGTLGVVKTTGMATVTTSTTKVGGSLFGMSKGTPSGLFPNNTQGTMSFGTTKPNIPMTTSSAPTSASSGFNFGASKPAAPSAATAKTSTMSTFTFGAADGATKSSTLSFGSTTLTKDVQSGAISGTYVEDVSPPESPTEGASAEEDFSSVAKLEPSKSSGSITTGVSKSVASGLAPKSSSMSSSFSFGAVSSTTSAAGSFGFGTMSSSGTTFAGFNSGKSLFGGASAASGTAVTTATSLFSGTGASIASTFGGSSGAVSSTSGSTEVESSDDVPASTEDDAAESEAAIGTQRSSGGSVSCAGGAARNLLSELISSSEEDAKSTAEANITQIPTSAVSTTSSSMASFSFAPQSKTSSPSLFGGSGASGGIFGGSGGTSAFGGSINATTTAANITPTTTSTIVTSGGTASGAAATTTAAVTTTTASVFSVAAANNGSMFGGNSSPATTSGSAFGGFAATTTTGGSLFGGQATTTSGGLFGAQSGTPSGTAFTTTTESLLGGQLSTTTSTAGSLSGGQSGTTTSTTGSLSGGQSGTATSTTGSLFGGQSGTATSTTGSLFGGQSGTAPSTTGSLFGGQSGTTTSTTGSLFGGQSGTTASTTGSLFGGQSGTTTSTTGSLFGGQSGTTTGTTGSLFGGQSGTTTSTTGSLFGVASSTTASSAGSLFGGQTSATTSSAGSAFGTQSGATTGNGTLFGGQGTTSSSASSSVFGGQNSSSNSMFGGTGATPLFGSQTPASSGAAATPLFGGQPAQSVFGGSSTATSSSPAGFGQAAAFGSQTPSSGASTFGQSATFGAQPSSTADSSSGGGLFGGNSGGGLFGGLGGKPSAENVNKNVFGGSSAFGSSAPNTALFGNQSGGGFGSQASTTPTSGGLFGGGGSGTFTAPGAAGGSVAASGFGAFQSPKAAAFGCAPTFGGSTSPGAFGSSPSFGGGASFGAAPTFGNPAGSPGAVPAQVFGSSGQVSDTGGFAAFAGSQSPTFGALAQTGGSTGFGSMAQQQGGFGAQPTAGFGGGGFGSPSFGGSAFGGSSDPTPAGSSFASYR